MLQKLQSLKIKIALYHTNYCCALKKKKRYHYYEVGRVRDHSCPFTLSLYLFIFALLLQQSLITVLQDYSKYSTVLSTQSKYCLANKQPFNILSSPHHSLRCSIYIIYCSLFNSCSEEEMINFLRSSSVVHITILCFLQTIINLH